MNITFHQVCHTVLETGEHSLSLLFSPKVPRDHNNLSQARTTTFLKRIIMLSTIPKWPF